VEAETLRRPAGTSPRSSVAVRRGRLGRQGGARGPRRGRTPVVALPLLAPTVSPEVEPLRVLGASPLPVMAWAMARPADRDHGSPGAASRTPAPTAATTGGGGIARRRAPGQRRAENARGRPGEACRATSPGVRVGGERAAPGCCWHGLGRRRNNLTMPPELSVAEALKRYIDNTLDQYWPLDEDAPRTPSVHQIPVCRTVSDTFTINAQPPIAPQDMHAPRRP